MLADTQATNWFEYCGPVLITDEWFTFCMFSHKRAIQTAWFWVFRVICMFVFVNFLCFPSIFCTGEEPSIYYLTTVKIQTKMTCIVNSLHVSMDLSEKTCDNSELWNCRNIDLSLNRPHKTFSLIFWSVASFTWWRRHRWWSWRWSSPSRCWPHIRDACQSQPESWWTCRSWWRRDRWWRCQVRMLHRQSLHQWRYPHPFTNSYTCFTQRQEKCAKEWQ